MTGLLWTAALVAWLCVAISRPRPPMGGGEVADLVYTRLLGRREAVALFATVLLGVAFWGSVLAIRNEASADNERLRNPCAEERGGHEMCWRLNDAGEWIKEQG